MTDLTNPTAILLLLIILGEFVVILWLMLGKDDRADKALHDEYVRQFLDGWCKSVQADIDQRWAALKKFPWMWEKSK